MPGPAELGLELRLRVTATNAAGAETVTSEPTAAVEAGPPPESTEPPSLTILGRPSVGATATTDGGAWEHAGRADLAYQWQRCNEQGDNCADIPDEESPQLELASGDAGARVRVQVTAGSSAGSASSTSGLSPVIAPAGTSAVSKIVYVSDDRTEVLLDGDGPGEPVTVADCASLPGGEDVPCGLFRPKISPDGQMIAVNLRTGSGEDPTDTVVLMNHDGSDARTLTAGRDPAWSADGTEVLFTAETDGETHIAVINADGRDDGEPRQIATATEGSHESPDASPDGTRLAYTGQDAQHPTLGLYVAAADGSDASRLDLPDRFRAIYHPQFTADGTQILFEAAGVGVTRPISDLRQVWTINPDGSGLRALTDDSTTNSHPSARPDGKILVTRFVGGVLNSHWGETDKGVGWGVSELIDPEGDDAPIVVGEERFDANVHRASISWKPNPKRDCDTQLSFRRVPRYYYTASGIHVATNAAVRVRPRLTCKYAGYVATWDTWLQAKGTDDLIEPPGKQHTHSTSVQGVTVDGDDGSVGLLTDPLELDCVPGNRTYEAKALFFVGAKNWRIEVIARVEGFDMKCNEAGMWRHRAWKSSAPRRPSQVLAAKLEAFGTPRPGPGFSAHHIIPTYLSRVEATRIQARGYACRIRPNEEPNGVWVPTATHRKMHNGRHFNWIYRELQSAMGRNGRCDYAEADTKMNRIKDRIASGEFPGKR